MRILQVSQGTEQWHAERARRFTASEAPAMMGASKYTTRSQLLHQKATGITPEVTPQKQAPFDRGHETEAQARAIVEDMLGEDLFPATALHDEDDRLLASFDGVTMTEAVIYEHKLWSEALAAQVRAGELEPHYYWQLEHQLLVSGAEYAVFVCSDGTREKFVHMEYRPMPGRREALLAGWDQFAKDLDAYAPTEIKERPAAEVTLALPALVIHAKGEITTSNMKEYGEALAKRLAEVRAIQLITDQDFSNAKESAKLLRENIQQAKLAKDGMLAQTVSVGEAARMIDAWCEDMRVTALKLEQDVEREDKAKKAAMIAAARSAYEQHIESAKLATGGPWVALPTPDWASAIKSKRNFASMQDALDTMLANAKIAVDESARKIRAALAALDDESKGCEHLFHDRLAFISKPADDVRALVRGRIAEHRAAEERRAAELAERERARIRAEEEARAAEKVRQEQEAAAREQRQREEAARAAQAPAATPAPTAAPIANVVPMPTKAPAPATAPTTAPTLRLGVINERIAPLSIDAAGLAALGFPHVATEKAAKLYHEADFPRMVDKMLEHLVDARDQQRKAAAA